METTDKYNCFKFFHQKSRKIFLLIFFMLLTILLILTVVLPAIKAELLFPAGEQTQLFNTSHSDDHMDHRMHGLASENAWLRTRLTLAGSDSLVLLVNLPDSIVSLQMNGVIVFETAITGYKISRIFNKYSPLYLTEWCKHPFTVKASVSSIPKMPVIYKKAPKDTIEAAKQQNLTEVPTGQEDTWFSLYTDRNLKLAIKQNETPSTLISEKRKRYFRKTRKLERRELVKSMANFEIPVHFAYITIYVSRSDARVIYRALPEHALVVLRL